MGLYMELEPPCTCGSADVNATPIARNLKVQGKYDPLKFHFFSLLLTPRIKID